MSPAADQLAVFEALLSQLRRLAGPAANVVERALRRSWSSVDDRDALLHAMAQNIRERRAQRTGPEDRGC